MGRGCNPRGQNCRRRFSNASWILEQVGHVLEQGKGREGLLGRGVSVSACAYTLPRSAYCLMPTAYCLLPPDCCLCCAAVSHVCVCVCVRRIDSRSKTILLGSQVCVCVWPHHSHGEATELPFVVACCCCYRFYYYLHSLLLLLLLLMLLL